MSEYRKYTDEEKAAILDEFKEAGISVPQFAKQKEISPSTLRGWLKSKGEPATPKRKATPSTVNGGDDLPPQADEEPPLYEEGEPVIFTRGPFKFAAPNAAYAYFAEGKMVRLVKGKEYTRPYTAQLAKAAEQKKIVILGVSK